MEEAKNMQPSIMGAWESEPKLTGKKRERKYVILEFIA